MRDIALKAELSPGLIYHYFNSKDGVYGQICEEAFQILLRTITTTDLSGLSPLAKLEALGKAYIHFYMDYPEYFEIISFKELGFKQVGLPGDIKERLNQLSLKALSALNDVVIEGMQSGAMPSSDNPWEVSISLWSSIEGIIFIHKRGYLEMFDLDIMQLFERQMMPILVNGIRMR